ncbi:hypothetical protein G6514_001481 [Epicoccum nigrum]|nr:hypothetical protein G6514_001481 [Epicoccum nigrum]
MHIKNDNPWHSRPSHSGSVCIGTHTLWASVAGPIRTPTSPLLIFITGAGASSAVYIKLREALSKHTRVLSYDRAGYDQSTLPPLSTPPDGRILAMDTAHDLTKLLKATQLEPPYIPMAHSYGGIIARSFLELHKENPTSISGLILCDTATELMLQVFPRIPDANLEAVARNVDWEALTHLREESGMSDAEYAYAMEAQMRTVKGLAREDTHASGRALALCEQLRLRTLGSRPLLVTRSNLAGDFQRRYDEGVRLGDGTEEEREKAREFILLTRLYQDQIARVQGLLSSEVAFRAWEDHGHDAPIRNVDFVVGEVVGWLQSSVDV